VPDVPALGETLPGYEASAWFGIGGPNADFAKLISDEVKKWSRVILAANMKRE